MFVYVKGCGGRVVVKLLFGILIISAFVCTIGFPAYFRHLCFNFINFQFNFVRRSLLRSDLTFNFVKLSFTFVFLTI